jgi:hypothetical protein
MENSDEKIVLEVEYEYEEFKRVYLDSLNKIPIYAGIVSNSSNILIIVTISFIALYLYGQFSIFLLLCALLIASVFLAGTSRMAALIFKKWFEFSAKDYHRSERWRLALHKKFVFEDDGIEVIYGETIKKISWAEIAKAAENDRGLFIFYGNHLIEYIPKRIFDVYGEWSRLKSFIEYRLGDKAEF